MVSLGLLPTIQGEGKEWRFLGIQSKNRAEWFLLHLANMFCKATTVAFYDTLGVDSMKYILDQTELTTISTTPDLLNKIFDMKRDDSEGKMKHVANIIVFEDGFIDMKHQETAKSVGLSLVSF